MAIVSIKAGKRMNELTKLMNKSNHHEDESFT